MPLRRQEDVADLGEQLGLDPRPLEAPAHTSPAVVTVRLVPHRSDAPGRPEVGPGSPSEGSAKFRIRSGTELPPGDESLERQEGFYNIVRGALALWYKRLETARDPRSGRTRDDARFRDRPWEFTSRPEERTPPRRWRHTGPWSHSRGNRSGFGIPARMQTQGRRTAGRPDGSRPPSGASPMTGVRGRTGPSRGRPPAAGLSGRSPPRRERAGRQDPRSGHPTPGRAAGGPVTARPAALRDVALSACPEQDRPAGTPGRPSSRRSPASTHRCLPVGWRARR